MTKKCPDDGNVGRCRWQAPVLRCGGHIEVGRYFSLRDRPWANVNLLCVLRQYTLREGVLVSTPRSFNTRTITAYKDYKRKNNKSGIARATARKNEQRAIEQATRRAIDEVCGPGYCLIILPGERTTDGREQSVGRGGGVIVVVVAVVVDSRSSSSSINSSGGNSSSINSSSSRSSK